MRRSIKVESWTEKKSNKKIDKNLTAFELSNCWTQKKIVFIRWGWPAQCTQYRINEYFLYCVGSISLRVLCLQFNICVLSLSWLLLFLLRIQIKWFTRWNWNKETATWSNHNYCCFVRACTCVFKWNSTWSMCILIVFVCVCVCMLLFVLCYCLCRKKKKLSQFWLKLNAQRMDNITLRTLNDDVISSAIAITG